MDDLKFLILMLVCFTYGFVWGQVSACERGGCYMHGKDYKKRSEGSPEIKREEMPGG